jgi:hypothetical protein
MPSWATSVKEDVAVWNTVALGGYWVALWATDRAFYSLEEFEGRLRKVRQPLQRVACVDVRAWVGGCALYVVVGVRGNEDPFDTQRSLNVSLFRLFSMILDDSRETRPFRRANPLWPNTRPLCRMTLLSDCLPA